MTYKRLAFHKLITNPTDYTSYTPSLIPAQRQAKCVFKVKHNGYVQEYIQVDNNGGIYT